MKDSWTNLQKKLGRTSVLTLSVALSLAAEGCAKSERISVLGLNQKPTDDPLILGDAFQSASKEFRVPVSVLQAVSYVETQWSAVVPEVHSANEAQDTDHHLRVYGVMGLKNDDVFGNSLFRAASLIGKTSADLQRDSVLNIRGAAALLRSYQSDPQASETDPSAWYEAIKLYSGMKEDSDAESYLNDVFAVLRKGVTGKGIEIASRSLLREPTFKTRANSAAFSMSVASDGPAALTVSASGEALTATKPSTVWDPSPNYTAITIKPRFIVIHDTEGGFSGAVSWLKDPVSNASAHYVIRSSDGFIKQLVRDTNKAWHARCWNTDAIGIEHEGYEKQPTKYFTEAMYASSAKLVRYLTQAYSIPRTQVHIIGHNAWQQSFFPQTGLANCNDHTDPGSGWKWAHYLGLVTATDSPPPPTDPGGGTDPTPIKGSCAVVSGQSMTRCCTSDTEAAYFTQRDVPWCSAGDLQKFDNESCSLASGANAGTIWRCRPLPAVDAGTAASGSCVVPAGQSASQMDRCCTRDTNQAYFLNRTTPWCDKAKLKRIDASHCDFPGQAGSDDGIKWSCG